MRTGGGRVQLDAERLFGEREAARLEERANQRKRLAGRWVEVTVKNNVVDLMFDECSLRAIYECSERVRSA